ncbi:hypothetical protein GYMLUDRAFT_61335 [Collybiopsis luxurians FD-317 M1]|uniref:Uncharacterized protein n=1 Tax=Collybiopsis luxurians FD-317 M1 TaxID=944289 RepID=A0A0D0B2D1_9AGAR|nr:hypothetical protein GYMLUDRAFT_61335 [Collybiopsis luxurians FD-317 M1]
MYGLATLDWLIDVRRVWTDLKTSVPALLDSPARDESTLNTENVVLRIIQAITNNICVIIGDLVVCWRVCVVYSWSGSTIITAIILMLALFSTALTCNLTQIGVGFPNVTHLHALQPSQLYIDIIALSFSAIINIWATGMIALKVWQSRRQIKLYLSGADRRSSAQSIMTIFVESGVVYTILWILKNIIIIPGVANTSYTNYAIFVMNQAVVSFSESDNFDQSHAYIHISLLQGMYPTVILVLVVLQRSHIDNKFQYSASNMTGTSGTVRFAHGTHTTTATGTVSQHEMRIDTSDTAENHSDLVISIQQTKAMMTDKPYDSESSSKSGSYDSFMAKEGRSVG